MGNGSRWGRERGLGWGCWFRGRETRGRAGESSKRECDGVTGDKGERGGSNKATSAVRECCTQEYLEE